MITRRYRFAIATLILVFLAVSTFAQKKKAPAGPRAIAVMEWTGQGLRLAPISLMMEGQFYDASIYRANPVPFALDEGNVYEVQRAGEPIGYFTVTQPAQIQNGAWIGEGKWLSNEERRMQAEARAKASATPSKPVEENDEPPVLRRGDKKPATATPPPATSAPPPSAPAAAAPPPPAPMQETSSDPDRPVLRRGKPAEEQATKLGNEKLPMKAPAKMPSGLNKLQVAVSDASSTESRPYTWKWSNLEEEQKMRSQIEKLAIAALNNYATKSGGPKPGKMEDVEIHAFDLDYNNSPDVILSARVLPATETPARKPSVKGAKKQVSSPAPNSGFEYYVTLVGREDIYATLQKIFAAVTDNKHLDAYPRMQVIDAVDADGNGSGDLLFRRISDLSSSFVLYKVYSSHLEELIRVPEPKMN